MKARKVFICGLSFLLYGATLCAQDSSVLIQDSSAIDTAAIDISSLKGISMQATRSPLFSSEVTIYTSRFDPFAYNRYYNNSYYYNYRYSPFFNTTPFNTYTETQERCFIDITYSSIKLTFATNPEKARDYKGYELPNTIYWEDVSKVFLGDNFLSATVQKRSNLSPLTFEGLSDDQALALFDVLSELRKRYHFSLKISKKLRKALKNNHSENP